MAWRGRLMLAVALAALAATAAGAEVVQVDLPARTTTAMERTWRATAATRTVEQEWQLDAAGEAGWEAVAPARGRPRYRQVQAERYRRQISSYPQEAEHARQIRTTVRPYELQTFGEVPVERWLPATTSQVVEQWLTDTFTEQATAAYFRSATYSEEATVTVTTWRELPSTRSVQLLSPPLVVPGAWHERAIWYDGPVTWHGRAEAGHLTISQESDGRWHGDLQDPVIYPINRKVIEHHHLIFSDDGTHVVHEEGYGPANNRRTLTGEGEIQVSSERDALYLPYRARRFLTFDPWWSEKVLIYLQGRVRRTVRYQDPDALIPQPPRTEIVVVATRSVPFTIQAPVLRIATRSFTVIAPRFQVTGWDLASGSFTHEHVPGLECPAAMHLLGRSGDTVRHGAHPVVEPIWVTRQQLRRATRSLEVTILVRTVATASALLTRTRGEDTEVAATPWYATGRQRDGQAQLSEVTATRWRVLQERTLGSGGPVDGAVAARQGAASYLADFQVGHGPGRLSGGQVRVRLRSQEGARSKAAPRDLPRGTGSVREASSPVTPAASASPRPNAHAGVAR